MPDGIHRLASEVWTSLATGAGAGFLARDALGLGQPLVALAWTVGALLPLVALHRQRSKGAKGGGRRPKARGRASVEPYGDPDRDES